MMGTVAGIRAGWTRLKARDLGPKKWGKEVLFPELADR